MLTELAANLERTLRENGADPSPCVEELARNIEAMRVA